VKRKEIVSSRVQATLLHQVNWLFVRFLLLSLFSYLLLHSILVDRLH
jgi:hypothetical protein